MSKEIARRERAIKKHVVDSPIYVEPTLGCFEVWQPYADAWFDAIELRSSHEDYAGCLLQYLRREDYHLVALVMAYSFDDVYRLMNHIDEKHDEDQQVLLVAEEVRSMSIGDVIVPMEGVPMYVAEHGFLPLVPRLPG